MSDFLLSSRIDLERPFIQGALAFTLAAITVFLFLRQSPLLYDNDSYYHLAIARAYATEGILDSLRWTRFSTMAEGFGDKEFLFHLLLAPFSCSSDVILGGQLALTLLLASIFTVLALLARPILGRFGFCLPFALVLTSTEFDWRLVRLRPELLSLLLLLLALWAIARRRYRSLGVIAFGYALSYTAFHAFLGLCVIQFLVRLWAQRRCEWSLLLYPTLGTLLGLLVHPHFPHNLEIWVLQSFDFFTLGAALDRGTEIRPNTTDVTLMVNLGYFLLLLVLARSASDDDKASEESRRRFHEFATTFGIAAFVFGALYLLMSRFSLYLLPFSILWLLFYLAARGRRIGRVTRLPFRGQAPLWIGLVLCGLVSFPEAWHQAKNYHQRNDPGPDDIRLVDRIETSRALPEGAHVAARWQQTPIYMLWAPQALYLNVLDPVFQARTYPAVYAAQERLFAGQDPDVARSLVHELDSDYLAFSLAADTGRLRERLDGDPRFERLHSRINAVYRLRGGANSSFELDWRIVPPSHSLPVEQSRQEWRPYPRTRGAAETAFEGYVDLSQVTASRCVALSREESGPGWLNLELAPYGPTQLWLDGDLQLQTSAILEAVLGRGLVVRAPIPEGLHTLTVSTCRGHREGPIGFYFRRLEDPLP